MFDNSFRSVLKAIPRYSQAITRYSRLGFQLASLVTLLAVLAALPIIQLIAFGYLLNVAGCFARGSKFHDAVAGLDQAGQIGMAAIVLAVLAMPTPLLTH